MSVVINVEVGAAPQGGTEALTAINYANRAAFIAAAVTAVSSSASFVEVETEKEGKTEKASYNLNKIRSVV